MTAPPPIRSSIRATRSLAQPPSAPSSSTTRATAVSAPSSSRRIKRKLSLSDEDVDESADVHSDPGSHERAAFDINEWKDDLRSLYSADCSLSEKDVSARLEVLFARLPDSDEPTKKIALEYLGVLRDAVQESVQADYDHARKRRKAIESEMKSTRAELKKLQSKAAAFDEKFYQAERDNDVKNSKLVRVKSVSAMVEGLVGSLTLGTDDAGTGVMPPVEPELHSDVGDDPEPEFITVHGFLKDVERKYNAVCIGDIGTRSTTNRDWKVWPLSVPGNRQASGDNGKCKNMARASFCSTTDVMEAPPHLKCTKCKEGPRTMRGFPSNPAGARVVQPRCLYTIQEHASAEAVICLACRRTCRGRNTELCCGDKTAIRSHILDILREGR